MMQRPATIRDPRRGGFTLIEMLVVVGVISLLLSVMLLVGSGALDDARVKDTRIVIGQLNTAIDAFRTEQVYVRVAQARRRFGDAPPDDLMSYTPIPVYGYPAGSDLDMPNLMQGRGARFVSTDLAGGFSDDVRGDHVPSGDIKALVVALRSRPRSRAIYESIAGRFRRTVPRDNNGDTREFFDFNDNGSFDPLVDRDVQFVVDSWGNPLEYYNVRAYGNNESPSTHGWAAQRLVLANSNQPVIVSYGLDGAVQIDARARLQDQVSDMFMGVGSPGDPCFNSPYHEDNIYSTDINDRVREIPRS